MRNYTTRKKNYLKKNKKYRYKSTKKSIKKSKKSKKNRKNKKTKKMYGGKCGCEKYPLKGGSLGPVGYSWKGGDESTWPGAKGFSSMSNHFPVSKYGITPGGVDPAIQSRGQKGGFLQDLVNLGRYGEYDARSVMNGFMGVKQPLSPLPYDDQPIDKDIKVVSTNPPDITKYYVDANKFAGKL